jgi:putative PIN family toxin of toxin-antitoxin system
MKVVLDTNVIVSAMINPYGVPASIVSLVLDEKVELCYDSRILIEYRDVLSRPKFSFSQIEINGFLEYIKEIGTCYLPARTALKLKDPEDLPFVEVAVVAGADFLITGNIGHYPKRIKTTKIVLPKDFVDGLISYGRS